MSRIAKAITLAGFVAVLVIEYLFVRSYLPTANEAVEIIGAYLLLTGSGLLFAGLSLLLTETPKRHEICAILTLVSIVLLLFAYASMMRW